MVSLSPNSDKMSFADAAAINEVEFDVVDHSDHCGTPDTTRLLSDSENIPMPLSTTSTSEFVFKPVDTISTGVFLISAALAVFVTSTVMPIECETGDSCHLNTLSLLLYLHCLLWGISLICDQCIQYQHITLRRRGYLEFYSEMRMLSQLPFWTISTWSTLLLSVSTILHDYCKSDGTCGTTLPLKKSEYVMICMGLELLVLIPTLCMYISKIWRFNSVKSLPDVLRDDEMANSQTEFAQNSLGRIDEEIYQRQADLILHYKEQNAMLRKTVMNLSSQFCNRTSSA